MGYKVRSQEEYEKDGSLSKRNWALSEGGYDVPKGYNFGRSGDTNAPDNVLAHAFDYMITKNRRLNAWGETTNKLMGSRGERKLKKQDKLQRRIERKEGFSPIGQIWNDLKKYEQTRREDVQAKASRDYSESVKRGGWIPSEWAGNEPPESVFDGGNFQEDVELYHAEPRPLSGFEKSRYKMHGVNLGKDATTEDLKEALKVKKEKDDEYLKEIKNLGNKWRF